jgi:hypothetical protein
MNTPGTPVVAWQILQRRKMMLQDLPEPAVLLYLYSSSVIIPVRLKLDCKIKQAA